MDHLCNVMLLLFSCTATVSTQVGVITLSQSTYDITLGLPYTLYCIVTEYIGEGGVSFERNGLKMCEKYLNKKWDCNAYTFITNGYDCDCSMSDTNTSEYSFTIQSFTAVDATRWSCTAVKTAGVVHISNFVDLYFSKLTLSGNVKEFDADGVNSITFTCITGNVTQRAGFRWINITGHGDRLIGTKVGLRRHYQSYSQEFKFIPHWYQDKDKIACQVFNWDTNTTTTSNVAVLSLIYPSQTPPIIYEDNPNSHVHSEITTQEGALLKLSCKVTGGRPRVSHITLSCGTYTNTSQTVGPLAIGHLSFKVTRDFHNQICLCSANHVTGRYHLITKVTLKVNYVAMLRYYNSEKKIILVICEVKGRPGNYRFTPFIHFWAHYRIRELLGQRDGSNRYVIMINDVTYADSGRYQCGVSNDVEELNEDTVQTHSISIEIGDHPILDVDEMENETVSALLGKTVVFKRKLFSVSNITFHSWIKGRGQHLTGHVSMSRVTLSVYNTTVGTIGYSLTLKIPEFNQLDQGVYTLLVCNKHGCAQFYTTLIREEIPVFSGAEPVKSSTSGSILIPAVSGVAAVMIVSVMIVAIIIAIKKRRNLRANNGVTGENPAHVNNTNLNSTDNHDYMELNLGRQVEGPAVEYVNTQTTEAGVCQNS